MKPSQRAGARLSCSCSSCTYKSESERPSLRRILAEGSRIDKLYYGKYIPLRERKLLDKLVKTRAVYDDIRNQLLSESDVSIKEKANLKPRKRMRGRPKEMAATDKSSAILEFVDLVDKGEVAGRKKLGECCSCCSCGSKLTQAYEHASHGRRGRHRQAHGHGGLSGGSMSRTSMIHKKMGDLRKSFRFKAKSIKSAPCACTTKLSGTIKRQLEHTATETRETYEQNAGGHRRSMTQKPYQKIKRSKARLIQSMGEGGRKVKDSKTRISKHIDAEYKKSLAKIKQATHKVNENFKTVVRKSFHRRHPPSEELNFEEYNFPIKKDSIVKFKERLHRKKQLKYCPWKPGGDPECDPDECCKTIKLRRLHRDKKVKSKVHIGVDKNIGVTSSASSVAVLAYQKGMVGVTETDDKQKRKIAQNRHLAEQRKSISVGVEKTDIEPREIVTKYQKAKDKLKIRCACTKSHSKERPKEIVESVKKIPPISGPVSQQESQKLKKSQQKSLNYVPLGIEIRKGKSTKKHGRSDIEKSSQTKLAHSIKKAQIGSHALNKCFCTLKLKAKANRSKPSISASKNMTTATQSTASTRMLNKIDRNVKEHVQPKQLKLKKHRPITNGVSEKPRQKSVSSLVTKSLSTGSIISYAPKKVDKIEKRSSSSSRKLHQLELNPSQRQAVRIGSTFSFSVELYKDKPNDEIFSVSQGIVPGDRVKKHNQGTGKRKRLRHRHSQISSSTGKTKYTLTKHSLRRCFCTLKLVHADKKKMKTTMHSQGSATSQYTPDVTINVNKAIATDKKFELPPCVCEPGLCLPGEHFCQKRINTRKVKYNNKQSNTDSRRTKSISSLTTRSIPVKAKKVQSTSASFGSPSKKSKGKALTRIRTTSSSPERQVVRITSNFSFNIQFYRENQNKFSSLTPTDDVPNEQTLESSEIEVKPKKDKGYQDKLKKYQKSTSVLAKKKNRGSFIVPVLKRCLCTLKLQKTKNSYQKRVVSQAASENETPENNDHKNVTLTKGTRTKQGKHIFAYALQSYKCEPYMCVSRKCDPYDSLKKIQVHRLKEPGALKKKAKMKSVTSITYQPNSNKALDQWKNNHKKVTSNVKKIAGDTEDLLKPQRQAVRIGSAFSFSQKTEINSKTPKIITVSRVTVTETKITDGKSLKMMPKKSKNCGMNWAAAMYDINSSSTFSKSSYVFQYKETKSYFQNQKSLNSIPSNFLSNKVLKASACNYMLVHSNCILPTRYTKVIKKYTCSENCILKQANKEKNQHHKRNNMNKSKKRYVTSQKSASSSDQHTNISKHLQDLTKIAYNKMSIPRYYAMNVQVPQRNSVKYKSVPHQSHKQAVRVGSSVSFDIAFSKNKSSPAKYTPKEAAKPAKVNMQTKPPRNIVRTKGTKGYGVDHHDQDSQSITLTVNEGSGKEPVMQRCFCTLKLEKKGRNQKVKKVKPVQYSFDRGTATPPNILNDLVASRTMTNVGQNTTKQMTYKLLPYECEPQVCIPGECNPYECLERIKQRNKKLKDSGTGDMRYKTSSSNTGLQNSTQARQIQSKPRRHQRSRGSAASRSSNIVSHHAKPLRQAVRVGSSFSFNVEFYKENSQASSSPNTVVQRESVELERVPKQKLPKKVKVVGLQNEKTHKHRTSQMENVPNQVKSSKTDMKPHTGKLRDKSPKKEKGEKAQRQRKVEPTKVPISQDSKASQAKETKSFLNKCLCALKLKKTEKQPKQKHVNSNTNTKIKAETLKLHSKVATAKNLRKLKPYECEPGICVPGECNPYECEKLIKARNVKMFTDRPRTKSTSSSFKSSKTSKARRTQSIFTSPSTVSIPTSTKIIQKSPGHVEPLNHSSNRQVVRIGSNFSFNIEFYKDRAHNMEEVQTAAKAIKLKPPRIEPQIKTVKTGNKPKTKQKGSNDINAARRDRESQANKVMTNDRSSGIAPALKRCFCTLKLQKHNVSTAKYTTQKTGTGAMKDLPTLQNKGIMTRKKWKIKPYKKETTKAAMTTTTNNPLGYQLLPYECEPNFCIPGECDPYECEKHIKLRNTKHRTSGTSTKRYRKRSTPSYTGSFSGSKARKVQSPKNRDRKRSRSVSSKPFRSTKFLDSTRQSVKIGSGFSFDIEFSRNKSLNRSESQDKPVKLKVKRTKSMSSSARREFPRTRDTKMQYRKSVRDTDSQILAHKMRDSGVNPFLKRCFCTLKLQKSREVSKHAIGRAARDKNVYLATLLPYECEPGICIPGECDPYECEKNIKRRQMRSQLSGTERRSHDSSTSSTSAKYIAAKNQAKHDAEAQKHQKSIYAKREPQIHITNSENSSKQAVRLGSSFSFDVEFYKEYSAKLEKRPRTYSRPVKMTPESVKTKPIKLNTRSKKIPSSDIKQKHNKLQTKESKTESRSTGVAPLLKRCFCTLALNKQKNPPKSKTKATYRNDDLSDLYQFSKNVAVGTDKKFHNLKPYECEPNVCIPGQCDPYECYERIKRRLKDSGTETPRPKKKYASIVTSSKEAKHRSTYTQAMKDKQRRERPSMTSTVRERVKKKRSPRNSNAPGEATRQAVKIGSNFSFSVEFYKDRPTVNIKVPKAVNKIKDRDEKLIRHKTSKTSPQKTFADSQSHAGRKGYAQKSQADCIKNTSKGTTMKAFINRCFCTLNLHKNPKEKNQTPKGKTVTKKPKAKKIPAAPNSRFTTKSAVAQTKEKYTASKSLPYKLKPCDCEPNIGVPEERDPKAKNITAPPDSRFKTKSAVAQTKKKITAIKTLPYKLEPYECEPNICVPGECDPYECLERIKRRNIRRHSRRTGTHARTSQVSVSSMASRLVPRKSSRVQSSMKRTRGASYAQQVPRVVEQPRFAHMLDSPNRRGVKLGSNISFNIEFYKDKSQVPTITGHKRYDDYTFKVPELKQTKRRSTYSEYKPKGVHRGTDDNVCDETCETQTEITTKDKTAGVNNTLKRCFCTLKLQKKSMKANKVITVNRVAIENNYRMGYINAQDVTNNQQNRPLQPFSKKDEYRSNLVNHMNSAYKRKTHCGYNKSQVHENDKEMKTLYPYTPTKFNKNVSNTIIQRKTVVFKKDLGEKSYSYNLELATRKPRLKVLEFHDQVTKENRKRSNGKMFLQKLFARLFSKRKSEEKHNVEYEVFSKPKTNFRLKKPDTLKPSKSDRRPTYIKKSEVPKKTTSLKATRISEKLRARDNITYYLKQNKFSYYQSGDTNQVYPPVNRHLTKIKSPEFNSFYSSKLKKNKHENIMNVGFPFESNKIVQMAFIKTSKGNKVNNKMVNTTTNTEVKKTHTKNVTTRANPKKVDGFIGKCICLINKVISRNDLSGKNKMETLNPEEIRAVSKKNKSIVHSYPNAESDGTKLIGCSCLKNGLRVCPCPRKLSSGNKQVERPQEIVRSKKQNQKKKVKWDEFESNAKEQVHKSTLQSGDAPTIKANNVGYLKISKVKPSKNKTTKINTNATNKCVYPTPCPCCKGKGVVRHVPISGENKTKTETEDGIKYYQPGQQQPEAVAGDDTKNNKPSQQQEIAKTVKGKKQTEKKKLNLDKAANDAKKKEEKFELQQGDDSEILFIMTDNIKNIKMKKVKCQKSQLGAKIEVKAKGGGKDGEAKSCVCGSKICAEETETNKMEKPETEYSTPRCFCGSKICAKETKKMKRNTCICSIENKNKNHICECKAIETMKAKAKKGQISAKDKKIWDKFKEEDDKIKQTRLQKDKKLDKELEKSKNVSDTVLLTESVLDVLKLGVTSVVDLVRHTSRAIMYPRVTYRNLKYMAKNPRKGLSALGDAMEESGVYSTSRRVRARCCAMRITKKIKAKVESNPFTYFLLNINDPKKRRAYKKRKQLKRRREPMDFECSLYMASLRKKKCLAVYYACPWFYPHCLSMLTLWKQFTDIMMFIIAVVIWSPCIIGIELCRACLCCFFCTG